MELEFKDRERLSDDEWELYQTFTNRCDVDHDAVRELSERSNLHWFLYGFWVALGHELQPKIVFAKLMNISSFI